MAGRRCFLANAAMRAPCLPVNGSGWTTSPSGRSRRMAANAASSAAGSAVTPNDRTRIPSVRPTFSVSSRPDRMAGSAKVRQDRDADELGHDLSEQLEALGRQIGDPGRDPGGVSARLREALDQAESDRVPADAHDDGDGRGGLLGRGDADRVCHVVRRGRAARAVWRARAGAPRARPPSDTRSRCSSRPRSPVRGSPKRNAFR